ncbi:MAG: methyltransferase domain-containing protein [Dehalococcoidales bacterium]|nr:methyltransferase domain-containing protein [Dehalococcoidales bacterium]
MQHQHRFHDKHHDSGERARMLGSEQRRQWLKTADLIDTAGISPGMTCIDLGCGAGALSVPLVEAVGPAGNVYAVDTDKHLLNFINEQNIPENLVTVNRDAADTGLETETADACFIILVLHEVPAEGVIAETYRLLKPGGKIVVLEWRMDFDNPQPPKSERIGREHLDRLLTDAGFSEFSYIEWDQRCYVATAVK